MTTVVIAALLTAVTVQAVAGGGSEPMDDTGGRVGAGVGGGESALVNEDPVEFVDSLGELFAARTYTASVDPHTWDWGRVLGRVEQNPQFFVQLDRDTWATLLPVDRLNVLRDRGTERAWTGDLLHNSVRGTYYSAATGRPLFHSDTKYDSGSGWPSFWAPIEPNAIRYIEDSSLFSTRIEVVDSSDGSHLGHVFPDGPAPTGLRYCINALALVFVADGEPAPEMAALRAALVGRQ